jgi:hypothetical protein
LPRRKPCDPTRVLRFEASRRLRPGQSDLPPGRFDRPESLTAPLGQLDRPGWTHILVESSVSVLWLNRVTQWFSSEPLQTPRTRCSLRQSPLMTQLPRSPDSTLVWGSTKKPSTTSSRCSCHRAARTWLRWPPGPLNQAYLSYPHLEASPAMTFRDCSSPAPTPVKSQPAPAILSQESVHTTLSITHHTRKRPSTSPRTTHGPQSPPWWVSLQKTLWSMTVDFRRGSSNFHHKTTSMTKFHFVMDWASQITSRDVLTFSSWIDVIHDVFRPS